MGRVFSQDFMKPAWTVQFSQCRVSGGVLLCLSLLALGLIVVVELSSPV